MKNKIKFYVKNGHLAVSFECIDDIVGDKETLALWLIDDVGGNKTIVEQIDKVVTENLDCEEMMGNLFEIYVKQDVTEIHCIFEEEVANIKPCKLPTKLLREIVAVWLEEFEKYRNRKK